MKKLMALVMVLTLVAAVVIAGNLDIYEDSTGSILRSQPVMNDPANSRITVDVYADSTGSGTARGIGMSAPLDSIPFLEIDSVATSTVRDGYVKVSYNATDGYLNFVFRDATGTYKIASISASNL